jgi:enoyl reductase-like protein
VKITHFALALALTVVLEVPTHASGIKIETTSTPPSKYLSQLSDPLDEIMAQSVKLKKVLDSIRNNPQTTTAKKRELLTKFYPQWQANTVNFINAMKRKNASQEEIASTQLQLNKYISFAFVCEDSGAAMCAE